MPTISKEFDGAALLRNGTTVRVDATSLEDGEPTTNDPSTEIYVLIVGLPDGPLLSTAHTPVDSSWSAVFKHAVPPLVEGQELHLVGLALAPGEDPYVWEDRKMLTHR